VEVLALVEVLDEADTGRLPVDELKDAVAGGS